MKTDDCERIPVAINTNRRFAFLKRFLILTGPVWFGCAVVCVMTTLAAGTEILPSYAQCFKDEADVGLVSYLTTLVTQGFAMAEQETDAALISPYVFGAKAWATKSRSCI